MGSRILGFVRTAIFAKLVADSVAADSYNQANNLPTTIYMVIAAGVVTGILIPQIAKAMKQPDGGEDFINRLLTLAFMVIAVATVVCTVGTPVLIRVIVAAKVNASVAGYMHMTVLLGYWCMPQIFFYGMYTVLGQVLNARGRFTAYAWSPAWANLIQIAGLLAFWALWGHQPDPANWSAGMIFVMGASTTLGIAVQGLSLVMPLYRDGFRFRLRFGWRGYGFGEISRMTSWTFAAVAIGAVQSLLINRMATSMRGGVGENAGVNTMNYASMLYMLPISMIMVSVTTALFPAMANAWRSGDHERLKSLVRQGLDSPSILVIPSSIAIIGLGYPLIRVLFGLSSGGVSNVWWVTSAFCIGVWPNAVTTLKQRYYFAKQNGRMNFWLVMVPIVTQVLVGGAAMLWVPSSYGIIYLAAGQSLGSFIAAGIFLYLVQREMGSYGLPAILGLWAKVTLASAVAAVAGWDVIRIISHGSTGRLASLLQFLVGALVFCLVYWGASAVLRIRQVTSLVASVFARIWRRPTPVIEQPQPAPAPEPVIEQPEPQYFYTHDDMVQSRVIDMLAGLPDGNGPTPPPQPWLYPYSPNPPPQPWLPTRRPTPPPQSWIPAPPWTPTPPPQPWNTGDQPPPK